MKKILLLSFILILTIVLIIIYTFNNKKDHTFSCQTDYIEDRVEDSGQTLRMHVSIAIDLTKNSGIASFNGNLIGSKEIYKIKRTTSFSLVKSGEKYDMTEMSVYITKEDNAPPDKLKDFGLLISDINFTMFEAVKNKDSSFTIYNSHEPILVCSK
ncbi:TPA: hypothetical protein ACQ301_001736 [Yersinia enterocolitica]